MTCIDANNEYNREYRELRQKSRPRSPVQAGTRPKATGLRARIVTPSSGGSDRENTAETWPTQDIPVHDPPEALLRAQLPDDPDPAEAQHDVYNEPPFIVTPRVKADVEGKLGLFAALIGIPFEAMDDYCGKVFAMNCDNIIAKATPLILKSPGAVKFLTSTSGGWLEWIAFLQALWPVVQAIYVHHLAKARGQNNQNPVDPTMPPAPDTYDYSAV